MSLLAMQKILGLLVGLLLAVCVVIGLQSCGFGKKPKAQSSCNFIQNSDHQRVSWGAGVPIIMYIDESVPKQYFSAITVAAQVWNKVVGHEVLKIGGVVNSGGIPRHDGTNVIYYLSTWELDRAEEQARTTVFWSGSRIFEADIRINALDHSFYADAPAGSQVDMQSLMVHEFGHVLGLVHAEAPKSVMARTLAPATLRREVAGYDLNSIRCEY
jgi:hypothetical protein